MKIDAPRIRTSARAIEILRTPDEFYRKLKASIAGANKRIFLATLYIGSEETELVAALDSKLRENKELKVHILSDGIRGTREYPHNPSTASLLSPLALAYPSQVTVSLYQTPALRGAARLLPKRFNEGCGLQHMKLYGVDDEIVLSGANLSADYFTNRQDRYICIKNKTLTNYFWGLFEGVAGVSYLLKPTASTGPANFEMVWPHASSREDIEGQRARLEKCLVRADADANANADAAADADADAPGTYIYPLVGLGPYRLGNDNRVMAQLCASGLPYTLTAGYFNIDSSLRAPLLAGGAPGRVIVAAQEANGFFESRGLSRNIPALYAQLASDFGAEAKARGAPVSMLEWKKGVASRGGWSYHAKGLWLAETPGAAPFATVIGSSNYTRRAYKHDLEAGALITTTDPELQQRFAMEIEWLEKETRAMPEPPRLTFWQRTFVRLFGDRL